MKDSQGPLSSSQKSNIGPCTAFCKSVGLRIYAHALMSFAGKLKLNNLS